MKKIMLSVAVILATLAPAAMAQKIAVVDMGSVLAQHPQREAIAKKMEKDFGDRIAEVRKLEDELRKLAEKGQRDGALMSDKEKTELSRKGQALQADLQLKGQALQEDMRKREAQEKQKILKDVKTAIDSVADRRGYDLVLDAAVALHAKSTVDITKQVADAVAKGR